MLAWLSFNLTVLTRQNVGELASHLVLFAGLFFVLLLSVIVTAKSHGKTLLGWIGTSVTWLKKFAAGMSPRLSQKTRKIKDRDNRGMGRVIAMLFAVSCTGALLYFASQVPDYPIETHSRVFVWS